MRWNGTEDSPLGSPQSRGLPTWFVVPKQHWKQILETEQYKDINEDTLNLARNFLALEKVYFLTRCRNPECRDYQRLALQEYKTHELGKTLERLERDDLEFHHIICNGYWKPDPRERADLATVLGSAWESYRLGPSRQ